MALRSLGSSLLAKSTPGSATRDYKEKQITKPAIPGKGEIGNVTRDLVQQTNITPAAPGSEKVIAAGPGVEGSQVVSPTQPPAATNIMPGMGMPGPMPAPGAGGPMFQPSAERPSTASAPSRSGRTAMASSGIGLPSAPASGDILPTGASTSVIAPKAAPAQQVQPFLERLLGGTKSYAGEGGQVPSQPANTPYSTTQRNASQGVAQTLANFIGGGANASYKGNAVNMSNPVSRSLTAYANNPQVTGQGIGSLTDIGSQLRSLVSGIGSSVSNVGSNLRSTASSALTKLRSLFK